MWIVLDGRIEFKINVEEQQLTTQEVQKIADDMGLAHKEMVQDL